SAVSAPDAAHPERLGHRIRRGRDLHDRHRVAVPAPDEELLLQPRATPPLRVGGALAHHVGERPDRRARRGRARSLAPMRAGSPTSWASSSGRPFLAFVVFWLVQKRPDAGDAVHRARFATARPRGSPADSERRGPPGGGGRAERSEVSSRPRAPRYPNQARSLGDGYQARSGRAPRRALSPLPRPSSPLGM